MSDAATLTYEDGDTFAFLVEKLDDFLVEVTLVDGTVITGYLGNERDGITLRPYSRMTTPNAGEPRFIGWDDLKNVHVL